MGMHQTLATSVILAFLVGGGLLLGASDATVVGQGTPAPAGDPVVVDPVIEVIDVEFPYWRLIFLGQVENVPEPGDLVAEQISGLEVVFRPLLEPTERRSREGIGSTVRAEASVGDRVIGTAPNAYEAMETSRGDRVASLLGSIENLPELPESFSLVHDERGELVRVDQAPRAPELDLTRMDYQDGRVELAWTEPPEGRTPRVEVFFSPDRFESYERVHPEFYGEGAREALQATSFSFDPSGHYVTGEAYYLLVLANEGLRTAWTAIQVTPPEEPAYEYEAIIHDPDDGEQIWQDGFFTLTGSMTARVETPEHRFVGRPYRLQPIPATLEWRSSQDGTIISYRTDGTQFGVTCMARGLSAGEHRITLRAETPDGATARASVRVEVTRDGERPADRSFDCRVPDDR